MTVSPREVKDQNQVGFIHTDDPPTVGPFVTLDSGYRLMRWQGPTGQR